MDTTDEYIKMCEKAEEIQSHWKFEDGDYIYGKAHGCKLEVNMWSGYDAWDYPGYPLDGIWIPKQDQLQDMLYDTLEGLPLDPLWFIHSCYKTMDTVAYTYHNDKQKWDTMEKLWLSFVIYEKYNKIWNGSEWINLDR